MTEVHIPEVMAKEIVTIKDQSLARTLTDNFVELFAEAEKSKANALAIVVTSLAQQAEMKQARELRLKYKRIRCDAESKRKALKEDVVRQGRAIDGMANIIKALVEPVEAHLEAQEQFAARLAEKALSERAEKRHAELVAVGVDPAMYNARDMADEQFATLLEMLRKAKADKEAAEAAAKAEAEARAKAEAEEQARIRAENERLRKEREAMEAEARKERERAAKEKAEIEAKAKAEREAAEAQARKEREAKEAAERELARRVAEEKAAKEKAEAESRKAARAPDATKIRAYAGALASVESPKPTTREGAAVLGKITAIVSRAVAEIRAEADKLV